MDKDKIQIVRNCINCGKEFYTTFGYFRRKEIDYKWRCPDCMKQYRSNIQKSSNTNIGIFINNKLNNPDEINEYKKTLSERAKLQWDQKPDEDKQKQIQSMYVGHKEYIASLSIGEKGNIASGLKKYYQNRSEEEKSRHQSSLSKSRIQYFDNMSDEEKESYKEFFKKIWDNKSSEEKSKLSKIMIDYWKNMSDEERVNRIELYMLSQKNRWDNTNDEDRQIHGIKVSNGISKLSFEEKERIRKTHQQRWIDMSHEEKYRLLRKTFISSNGKNKFHKTFERMFVNSYVSNEYSLKEEIITQDNSFGKSWDYGIYDKSNNDLVMVIDLDGSYYHADNCDYDGLHSKEEYDERRFLAVPNGIKYHIIYEDKFKQSFEEMIKVLKLDYDSFINKTFNECRSISFPYPKYNNNELLKSWNQLIKMDCDSKYMSLSTNTRIGDRLINHFHPSIYHASVGKKVSPYDAWYDDDILKKVIKNRIIYVNILNPNKILQGFNISKIAPKVSVFSAGRAKIIIHKYLNDMNEIFDPFSGFSGRMLGTISLGKKYIGQDIADRHIDESKQILNFIDDHDVILSCVDILQSSGKYESLFTCPPYGDKEIWESKTRKIKSCDEWIDECLKRFKCKRYVFVVDHTEKYKDHIVDEIINKSHFNHNSEKIIVIKGE